MFGDLQGMMAKMKETQEKVAQTKKRLDTVFIDEQSSDQLLSVSISANNRLSKIQIADELLQDKEQLEDYLILVINKAIEKATAVHLAELDAVSKLDLPIVPGMEDLFK